MAGAVGIKNGAYLGDLAAQPQRLAVSENRDKVFCEFPDTRVFYPAPQKREKHRMVNAVKKLPEVDKKRVTLI
jgi:hypothetical protein